MDLSPFLFMAVNSLIIQLKGNGISTYLSQNYPDDAKGSFSEFCTDSSKKIVSWVV